LSKHGRCGPPGRRWRALACLRPAPVDAKAGLLTTPPNLKGWHNVPLARILEERLGATTYLGNDANLAALAEHTMGATEGFQHAVYITVNTGIGAGIIIDDHLFFGTRGLAAELGHMVMMADVDQPSSFEKLASGTALALQAQALLEGGEESLLRDMADSIDAVDAKMVSAAAKAGDRLARRLVLRAGAVIGLGVVSILHAFNP
jgi:glucokinase